MACQIVGQSWNYTFVLPSFSYHHNSMEIHHSIHAIPIIDLSTCSSQAQQPSSPVCFSISRPYNFAESILTVEQKDMRLMRHELLWAIMIGSHQISQPLLLCDWLCTTLQEHNLRSAGDRFLGMSKGWKSTWCSLSQSHCIESLRALWRAPY